MIRKVEILLMLFLLLSGSISSAYAAKVERTELSADEAQAFEQSQAVSAQTIDTTNGEGVGSALLGGFAIIGIVVVALIIIAAAK